MRGLPKGVHYQQSPRKGERKGGGRKRPYQVRISFNHKRYSLGYFATPEEAHRCYLNVRAKILDLRKNTGPLNTRLRRPELLALKKEITAKFKQPGLIDHQKTIKHYDWDRTTGDDWSKR